MRDREIRVALRHPSAPAGAGSRRWQVARLSLMRSVMMRWVGALVMTVGGLLFLFGRAGESPSAQQFDDQAAAQPHLGPESDQPLLPAESVRIEHRFVEVASRPAPLRTRSAAVVHAVNSRAGAPQGASQRFISRASRALLGDGRYRPQPFPRPAAR
jgi:hypothetical protein